MTHFYVKGLLAVWKSMSINTLIHSLGGYHLLQQTSSVKIA